MLTYEQTFQDCYVKLEGNQLKVGNDRIERTWNMQEDIPVVQSLRNKQTGKEWLATSENYDWLKSPEQKYAFYKEAVTVGIRKSLQVKADTDDDCGIACRHLRTVVALEYDKYLVEWIHMVYPQSPVLRSVLQVTIKEGAEVSCLMESKSATAISNQMLQAEEIRGDFSDSFPLAPAHCGWKSVRFLDRTDDNDNLVDTSHGLFSRRESRYMHGNLLFVEDHLAGEGITFIKEGPTAFSYLGDTKSDFFVKGQNVFTTGWGLEERDFHHAKTLTSYGSAIVLWNGDEECAYSALNEYHNSRHIFVPEKDAFIMSNTWGDMSSDGKLSEEFLLNELKKAKEIGINLYQIDDGWQNGTTSNSVNAMDLSHGGGVWGKGYYKENPRFWTVNDTRFPGGLEPVIAYAKENGIRIGLWFSPDSDNDFENWERDSSVLLELHAKYGISAFKMDGIKFESKTGEENLGKLLRKVVTESKGEIFFNMDTTAETRAGYFGRVQYGSLFIENRFTGRFGKWPNYYPHCTLRNLWMLSQYYPTNRLQMEFLNVKRNAELYKDDVLAPAMCGIEYSFAVTMFANPLAWMELTGLDEEATAVLKEIIPKYLKMQEGILAGHVVPIGEEPNGTRWTGFQSVKADGVGFLLIIKEYNTKAVHSYTLRKEKGVRLKLECLLGDGKQEYVEVNEEGKAVFELDGQFKYALYKYESLFNKSPERLEPFGSTM